METYACQANKPRTKKSRLVLVAEQVFNQPAVAAILIGSGIHALFALGEYAAGGSNYFSQIGAEFNAGPLLPLSRLLAPFLIPLLVTSVSKRIVIRKVCDSLMLFPEANPDLILKLDQSGEPVYHNRAAEEFLVGSGMDPQGLTQLLRNKLDHGFDKSISPESPIVVEARIGDSSIEFRIRRFPHEDSLFVTGRDVTRVRGIEDELRRLQVQKEEFLRSAAPLIYRASRSGEVVFLEGGFRKVLEQQGVAHGAVKDMQSVFELLGLDPAKFRQFHEELSAESESVAVFRKTERVELVINGVRRWYSWIGVNSGDGEFHQGQLYDIHEQHLLENAFADLRRATYGTLYLGERVATGKEAARRRELTVMFVDMVGSTDKLFGMEMDDFIELLEGFFEIVTGAVSVSSGYVDKFMGDGAMIVFGFKIDEQAPVESHPMQAVRAAADILSRCRDYNRVRSGLGRLELRIGIDSGEVVSGVFRNPERMVFTSIGPAVNKAARLEGASRPGEFIVSSGLYEKLQRDCQADFQALCHAEEAEVQLKGIPGEHKAYRVRIGD